jgi:crotonobetainyl-CoA:carnitine CoA-transferase CaiB-like acyl-CoA transferase
VWVAVPGPGAWVILADALGIESGPEPISVGDAVFALRTRLGRLEASEAANLAQAAGVEMVPVMSARDLLDDPHLSQRHAFVTVEHPDAGAMRIYGPLLRSSEWPQLPQLPAPTLGQDNDYVFGKLLGMSKDEIDELRAADVIN